MSSSEDESHIPIVWFGRTMRSREPDRQPIPEKLAAIEVLRAKVADWRSPKELKRFLCRLDPLVSNWTEGIPDRARDISARGDRAAAAGIAESPRQGTRRDGSAGRTPTSPWKKTGDPPLHLDACGRTPLGLAVERLDLEKVELPLDYGADAALVDLPIWECPSKVRGSPRHKAFEFEVAAGALAVVECLEKRGGYALDRRGASRVMKTFARMGAYPSEREATDGSWYEDERFVEQAKKTMILPRALSHPEVTTEIEEIMMGGAGGGRREGRREIEAEEASPAAKKNRRKARGCRSTI
ncbi:hypothetical protein TKK_0007715 [Trichogramma kaykai]